MKPQHVTVWKPNLATCWGTAPSALRPANRKSGVLLGGLASALEQGWSGAVPAGLATRQRVDQPGHSRLGHTGHRAGPKGARASPTFLSAPAKLILSSLGLTRHCEGRGLQSDHHPHGALSARPGVCAWLEGARK